MALVRRRVAYQLNGRRHASPDMHSSFLTRYRSTNTQNNNKKTRRFCSSPSMILAGSTSSIPAVTANAVEDAATTAPSPTPRLLPTTKPRLAKCALPPPPPQAGTRQLSCRLRSTPTRAPNAVAPACEKVCGMVCGTTKNATAPITWVAQKITAAGGQRKAGRTESRRRPAGRGQEGRGAFSTLVRTCHCTVSSLLTATYTSLN